VAQGSSEEARLDANRLINYLALLRIREKAARRDVFILGGVFVLSVASTFVLGMLERLIGREVYLVMALDVVFGIAFLAAYVRYQVIKEAITLADNLT
jgi:predicted neutral ceramidase superfamily lipid hydrolase